MDGVIMNNNNNEWLHNMIVTRSLDDLFTTPSNWVWESKYHHTVAFRAQSTQGSTPAHCIQ